MPRIRSIKPEFFTSTVVAELSRDARLTWIATWVHADDEGRADDDARLVRAQAYPFDDDITVADIESHLEQLAALGLIIRYEVAGRRYFEITNFSEHQHPNRPTGSKRPRRPDASESQLSEPLTDDSLSAHAPNSEGSPLEGLGKERLGREGEGASDDAPPPSRIIDLPTGVQPAGALTIATPEALTPFCSKHPGGTDRPCFACKQAREEHELHQPSKTMRRNLAVMARFAADEAARTPSECPDHPGWPHPDSHAGCAKCEEQKAITA